MNNFKAKIEYWDINKVLPYWNNTKTHTDEQVSYVASLITEFGNDVPIVVDRDGIIIKGHCRRLSQLSLGLAKVPVIVRSDLSAAQVKASRLGDNKSNESEWLEGPLKIELESLDDFDFDFGFDDFSFEIEEVEQDFSDKNKELDLDNFDDEMELKLKFNKEDFDFVTERLRNINQSLEIALMQVLTDGS